MTLETLYFAYIFLVIAVAASFALTINTLRSIRETRKLCLKFKKRFNLLENKIEESSAMWQKAFDVQNERIKQLESLINSKPQSVGLQISASVSEPEEIDWDSYEAVKREFERLNNTEDQTTEEPLDYARHVAERMYDLQKAGS